MIYSDCTSRVTPGCSQRLSRFNKENAGFGASSLGIDQELPTTKISSMLIVACGDSFTQGEGLDSQDQVYAHILARKFNATINNLAQSGASEYLILNQVEEAVKLKPDLIVIGHTSEYRWKVWDFRRNFWQGFIVANHIVENEKYYRNWILSEQILGNRRKHEKQPQAAWHAAGMLYFSDQKIVTELWEGAVAKQILVCQRAGIEHIHLCCFPHLYDNLKSLTNSHVPIHFDLEKHKDPAKDRSHAGPKSHLKAAELICKRFCL